MSIEEMTPTSALSVHFPILGLDISDRRIGVAIAEHPTVAPQPLLTYARISRARDLAQCASWVEKYAIGAVVIGLPVHMDGQHGRRAQWMVRFAEELRARVSVPVLLHDERLSTVEAREIISARHGDPDEVDAVAAALIVQRFLRDDVGVL